MAYIGNAKTPLLLSSNVRDDLVGGYDTATSGPFDKKVFALTQEVPGGDEKNVTVVRRKLLSEVVVDRTNLITFTENPDGSITLSSTDNYIAAALNVIQPETSNYEGDRIQLQGYIQQADGTYALDTFTAPIIKAVSTASYTRDQITLTLVAVSADDSQGSFGFLPAHIKVSRLYYGPWEILDTSDYKIQGSFGTPQHNKQIRLKDAPQEFDILYVLHRGESTYNFVPSPGSVDVHQLSDNLRTFVCDRYTGDNSTDTFALSQPAVSGKSLLVTVDGIVKECHDALANPEVQGDWKLNDIQGGIQTITFGSTTVQDGEAITTPQAPASGAKIRILHLGFASGNRRAVFVPGQIPSEPTDGSITSRKLAFNAVEEQNVKDDAITTSKIKNSQVNESKILLGNNEGIRLKYADNSIAKILGVSSNTTTELTTKNDVKITFPAASLTLSSTEISPSDGSGISLGNASSKFDQLHLSGDASVGGNVSINGNVQAQNSTILGNQTVTRDLTVLANTTITQDLTVSGNISLSATKTVDGVDISALASQVNQIQSLLNNIMPIGTIIAWPSNILPSDGNWLLCNGDDHAVADYPALANLLSGLFNDVGLPTDRFCVPDLIRRTPIGKHSGDVLGSNEGLAAGARSKSHTHTSATHTHDLSNHIHKVPAHHHSILKDSASGQMISTLAIGTSGGHTTSLTHQHSDITTGVPSTSLEHSHTLSHSHGGSTGIAIITHGHGTLTTGDPLGNPSTSHTHGIAHTHGISPHNHEVGYANQVVVTSIPGVSYDTTTIKVLDSSSATKILTTSQTLVTDSQNTTDSEAEQIDLDHYHEAQVGNSDTSANHSHDYIIGSQTDVTGSPRTGASVTNTLSHTHNVTGPIYTGASSSTGEHTHAASFFSGKIGDPNKPNGDASAGFNSDTPSVNLSGVPIYPTVGGVAADQSGATTTPHIVLNFIIKAKNSV